MVAEVSEASRLLTATVGEEVSVSDRKADASDSRVGVNHLNVVSISAVQATMNVSEGEEWTSWIQTDDCVDSSVANGFACDAGDVSWKMNLRFTSSICSAQLTSEAESGHCELLEPQTAAVVQEIDKLGQNSSGGIDAVPCRDVIYRLSPT